MDENKSFFVSLSVEDCAKEIHRAIVDGSITGELIDYYAADGPSGLLCVTVVYEKHYYRAGNRLTLTVTIDNLTGRTRVHCIAGGGGEGLFRFDWGAAEDFSAVAEEALAPYIV